MLQQPAPFEWATEANVGLFKYEILDIYEFPWPPLKNGQIGGNVKPSGGRWMLEAPYDGGRWLQAPSSPPAILPIRINGTTAPPLASNSTTAPGSNSTAAPVTANSTTAPGNNNTTALGSNNTTAPGSNSTIAPGSNSTAAPANSNSTSVPGGNSTAAPVAGNGTATNATALPGGNATGTNVTGAVPGGNGTNTNATAASGGNATKTNVTNTNTTNSSLSGHGPVTPFPTQTPTAAPTIVNPNILIQKTTPLNTVLKYPKGVHQFDQLFHNAQLGALIAPILAGIGTFFGLVELCCCTYKCSWLPTAVFLYLAFMAQGFTMFLFLSQEFWYVKKPAHPSLCPVGECLLCVSHCSAVTLIFGCNPFSGGGEHASCLPQQQIFARL